MREPEFLPRWYPQLRRRKRMVFLQLWMTAALAAGLGLWMHLVNRNEEVAREVVASLSMQLEQASSELEQMDRLEGLRRQWRQQLDALRRLGAHVQAARLMGQLSSILPPNVSLLTFGFDVEEAPAPLSNAARAALVDPKSAPMERRMRVKLQGVAPTDDELATFLTELNRIPFFEQIAPTYVKDRRQNGHILREFELSFAINLAVASGS